MIGSESFTYGFIVGSIVGLISALGVLLSYDLFFKEEPTRNKHTDGIPDFQQTLITLSKIPGLEIKGEGVHIKGPDLKGDGKT